MQVFDETRFRAKVEEAIAKVATVLDAERTTALAEDVPHAYENKFVLAEELTRGAIGACMTCLDLLGLAAADLEVLLSWAKERSVTLRLQATEACEFEREVTRDVEAKTKHVREVAGVRVRTDKNITKVTEYFWSFKVEWRLLAFQGNAPERSVELKGRAAQCVIKTSSKETPRPKVTTKGPFDVQLTWLLEHSASFEVARDRASCWTPRRNEDVEGALSFLRTFFGWADSVRHYFVGDLFGAQQDHGLDLPAINAQGVLAPVVPLLEDRGDVEYTPQLLQEHRRGMQERFEALDKVFPADELIISATEAKLVCTLMSVKNIAQAHLDGLEYIESMLRAQVIAAIGKIVTPADFQTYMVFHNRRLFAEAFQPKPFSVAVRRAEHTPEGTLSIEAQLDDGSLAQPVPTTVRWSEATAPMTFALSAATNVQFLGNRYLHGYVGHQFSNSSGVSLSLSARARQFSSFVLLVGRISGPGLFDPSAAIIIKDKDDLRIPLMLETIPTPKEFADAIESLSEEQQRFAKAYRSMQLASTLFAVATIQIKPALEQLLNLDDDSLTKELRLTRDLMDLFLEYQIPSDLISFGGEPDATCVQKVDEVKRHVKAMQDMILKAKQQEVQIRQDELDFAKPMSLATDGLSGGRARLKDKRKVRTRKETKKKREMRLDRDGEVSLAIHSLVNNEMMDESMSRLEPQLEQLEQPEQPKEEKIFSSEATQGSAAVAEDYTELPTQLDQKFAKYDEDSALRPTIIHAAKTWSLTSQKALLADPSTRSLGIQQQRVEKQRAFDLLDALTRSGDLTLVHASLHVMLAATHTFDRSLIDVVVQKSVNPVEKVERSVLILSSTVHNKPVRELVAPQELERVRQFSANLFLE